MATKTVESSTHSSSCISGQVVNLVTSDVEIMSLAVNTSADIVWGPYRIGVCLIIIKTQLGMAASIAALTTLVIGGRLMYWMLCKAANENALKEARRDERLQSMNELLSNIRAVKTSKLAAASSNRIAQIRKAELFALFSARVYSVSGSLCLMDLL